MVLQSGAEKAKTHDLASRNQQTVVHQSLQLQRHTHRCTVRVSADDGRPVAPKRKVDAGKVHVVQTIVSLRDVSTAHHEVVSRNIVRAVLRDHPRQRHGCDRRGNTPLLAAETVVGLVQASLE